MNTLPVSLRVITRISGESNKVNTIRIGNVHTVVNRQTHQEQFVYSYSLDTRKHNKLNGAELKISPVA